jgi:class 3 adenylate cyclase
VTGSTALGERLDPESLRHALARYFETSKVVLERHGGTVEKFVGDAVMAMFGIPRLHEDDALRAVRAAVDLRESLVALNETLEADFGVRLELRMAVNTGEVVTGTEERLATGDALNVVARLEQAAAPGEILLGEETLRHVRHAVIVEAVAPLALKGKRELFSAYRLVSVGDVAVGYPRTFDTAIVGRADELDQLRDALTRSMRDRACHLFTLLGTAGVGKSRLVEEFVTSITGATVVRGRCLSYGEGITYLPVVEIVKQLLGEEPAVGIAEFAADEHVASVVFGLLGDVARVAPAEETAWAVRKLLEAAASLSPLVVVFDDLQWGEPTFLDLVEHIADWSRDVPILLLCTARPEFLDRRPAWGGGKLNASTILLEVLSPAETDQLIEQRLGSVTLTDDLWARIRETAEGNPLFVEQILALLAESPAMGVVVPPTIQALLAARLDQLDPAERAVLARGQSRAASFTGAPSPRSPSRSRSLTRC